MAENQLTGVSGPDTSMYPKFQPMPQAPNPLAQIQQLQQLDLQNQQLQQGQANLGMQRVGAVNSMLGTLITKPDLSYDDVTSKLDDMVRNRIIPPNEKPAILQHLSSDPDQLRAQLKNSYIQTLDHASKMGMAFGQPIEFRQGDTTQFGTRSVTAPGQVTLPESIPDPRGRGTSIPMTLTPGENIASQPAIINGVPSAIPNVSRFTRTGGVRPTVPQAGAGAASNMAPRGMVVPPGTVQTEQAPGVMAAAGTSATTDAARATAFEEAASRAPDQKAILERMDMNAATFTGGPASPLLKKAGGYINMGANMIGAPTPIASQAAREAFDKDAALLAGQQSSTLGNTDAAKSLASVMTPGSSNTNEGIRNIAAVLKGNQDAITAKAQAWNAYKNSLPTGTARFSDFENQFHTHFSPRAFAMPYMSQPEREKMWNSMDAKEQAAVSRAYNEAKAKGYIQVGPNTQAPSP
jgi:hypothetical protein